MGRSRWRAKCIRFFPLEARSLRQAPEGEHGDVVAADIAGEGGDAGIDGADAFGGGDIGAGQQGGQAFEFEEGAVIGAGFGQAVGVEQEQIARCEGGAAFLVGNAAHGAEGQAVAVREGTDSAPACHAEQGRLVAGVGVGQLAGAGVQDTVEEGDEAVMAAHRAAQDIVDAGEDAGGGVGVFEGKAAQGIFEHGGLDGGLQALAGHVGHDHAPAVLAQWEQVEEVAPDGGLIERGLILVVEFEAILGPGRDDGQQALLEPPGDELLAVVGCLKLAEEAGVLQGDGGLGGEGAGEPGGVWLAQVGSGVQEAEQADAAPVTGAQDEDVAGAVEEEGFFRVQAQGGRGVLDVAGGKLAAGGGGRKRGRQGVEGAGEGLVMEGLEEGAALAGLVALGPVLVGGQWGET